MPKSLDMKAHFVDLLDSYFKENKGLSMRAFAKKVGVSEGTIRNWRDGSTTPNIEHLNPLAVALEVSIFHLLGIDEEHYLAPEDAELINLNVTNEKFHEIVSKIKDNEELLNALYTIVKTSK